MAALGVVALVTLVSLVLPEVSVAADTRTGEVVTEPAPAVPAVTIASAETAEATPDTSDESDESASNESAPDDAVPRIASETFSQNAVATVQPELLEVPIIASAPADTEVVAAATAAPPDLFTAARDLSPAEVARVLASAPDLNARDAYGQTPLMYAAGANSAAVVTALLAAGADPNAASDAGWTPLMYAARNTNDPAVVTTLLTAGADAQTSNESGQRARDIALAYNNSAAEAIPAARPEAAASPARDRQTTAPPSASLRVTPLTTPATLGVGYSNAYDTGCRRR